MIKQQITQLSHIELDNLDNVSVRYEDDDE